jgi:N-acetylglutamate synthase-like GNAT family acetyltransferase
MKAKTPRTSTPPDLPIEVRKARPADVPALLRLFRGEKGVTDFAGLHTAARFLSLIRSRTDVIIVASCDGEVVGALDAEIYRESSFSYFANIVVKRGLRGQGIGRRLIDRYEAICREKRISTVVALVYDWNKDMHALMRKRRYGNNGRLVEYVKRLS